MNHSRTTRDPAPLALTAVVLSSLNGLLLAMRLRLAPAEWASAWPWPAAWPPVDVLLALLVPATVVLAALSWRHAPAPGWRRTFAECLAWPALPLAIAWLILPAAGTPSPPVVLALPLLLLTAWWLHRSSPPRQDPRGRPHLIWLGLHGLAVAALLIIGCQGGGFADLEAVGLSLLLYPVYALAQLFLILAVLWPRLVRLSPGHPGAVIATIAVLFGLIHWPNPALVLLTAGGMVFWAAAYARGRRLWLLALSMGLLATLAAQGLPDAWTDHMRAGPRFVRQRAVPSLAAAADARSRRLPAGKERTLGLLADLYPGIVGRPASAPELERWWQALAPCRRGVLAWRFFVSDEYYRKYGRPAGETPLPGNTHWTRLPAPWPERIGTFTRPDVPTDWDAFLAHCYRTILGREGSAEEIAGWPGDLSPRQQQRLVEVLFEWRRELAAAPFDTLDCTAMRLHH